MLIMNFRSQQTLASSTVTYMKYLRVKKKKIIPLLKVDIDCVLNATLLE